MSDEIRVQLSALVDDELDEAERPLLLGRLQRDSNLREVLGRYQLISEVMRGAGQVATLGIADRVRQALEQDAALTGADKPNAGSLSWLKPVAGLAVAASVAVVAVLAVTSVREPAVETGARVASSQNVAPAVSGGEETWERIEPRIDKRMSAYLVNHNEYAASRGVQGVMPYVRIVGYENNRQ
ncbi:MAG: sigma-E factor negative regulatory protein [Thiogranum sp.]